LPSGQKRVNELFRRVQGQVIPRGTIATVAQQDDYMKRVRYNGGARSHLRDEGIVIFGHYGSHSTLAAALGLPVPRNGESLSVRLARSDSSRGARIDESWWRVADPKDPVVKAPKLPRP
ncbi:MAG: NaeI family type II restriction endonuclease, partial [Acidimicrobiia bacterium]